VFGAVLVASLIRAHWVQLKLQILWENEALQRGKHTSNR
jgi:hypothetical protein